MKDSLNIVIAGATGYIGLQLVKILTKHPNVNILYLCATQSIGKKIHQLDRGIKNESYITFGHSFNADLYDWL